MTLLQVKCDQKLLKDSLSFDPLSNFQFTKNLLEVEKGFDNLTHMCLIFLSLSLCLCLCLCLSLSLSLSIYIYIYIYANSMRDKSIITLISSLFQVTRKFHRSCGYEYHCNQQKKICMAFFVLYQLKRVDYSPYLL